MTAKIMVGTSGFSYPDWVGAFYPTSTKKIEMLEYYTQHFKAVEINSTYYRISPPAIFQQMIKKCPSDFEFVVKIYHGITHPETIRSGPSAGKVNSKEKEQLQKPARLFTDIDNISSESQKSDGFSRKQIEHIYQEFLNSLKPLTEAGLLSAVLAQFPYSFKASDENRERLYQLAENLADIPVVVEFRHISWLNQESISLLKELKLAFCCVDEPNLKGLLPPKELVTSNLGYVRFHSRDASKWWSSGGKDRYDYNYSEEELLEWKEKIQKMAQEAEKIFVFFNNCTHGHAPNNAKMLEEFLKR